MSEETEEIIEKVVALAPGLTMALYPQESEEPVQRRRGPDPLAGLRTWVPRTRLGKMVREGQILTYEEAVETGFPIREVEIVDA